MHMQAFYIALPIQHALRAEFTVAKVNALRSELAIHHVATAEYRIEARCGVWQEEVEP
jgi:hypothetical protein